MAHWFSGLGLDPVLQIVLTASCQASLLAVIVLASQSILGRWLAPRWRYALWSVVVIRLVMPIAPGSTWSIFNLFSIDPAPTVIVAPPPPIPTTGVVTYSLSAPEPSVTAPVHVSAWGMDDIALAVWLVGMGMVLSVIVAINIALAFRLRRRPTVTDPGLLELLESCKQEMGVRRSVLLYGDPKITSPALAGIFRPSLLIPPEILADLPREELRFIFLHELAHVKKHDIIQNWLLIALAAIHWFNPIIWFTFARLRADRELARDAMVLRATGTDANQAYGQTIIHTLERIARPNLQNPALAGIGDGMGQLKRRLRMIAIAHRRRPLFTAVGIMLLITLVTIGLTDASEPMAQEAVSAPTGNAEVDDDPGVGLVGEWRSLNSEPDPVIMTFAEDGVATITDDPHPTTTYNYTLQGDRLLLKKGGETLEFTYRLVGDEQLLVTFKGNTTPFARAVTKPIHVSLNKVVTANFDGNRLDNVIDYLRNTTGTNIYVNWRALEAGGVNHETRIVLQLDGPDVTGRTVLNRVLEYASGASTKPITFGIRGRVVVISTQADVVAAQASYPIEIPSADTDREATARALNRLNQPIPINFESNRLVNVLDYFRNVAGVNVFVDWPALEQAGVDQDTLVSLSLQDVVASEALRLVLHQVSYGNGDRVEFCVIDGVVTVSTAGDLPLPPTMEEVQAEVDRQAAEKLRQPIRIDFDQTPFEEVIQEFRDGIGLPFFANWAVLERVGVDAKTPVTLSLTSLPGDQALRMVLQRVSDKQGLYAPSWRIIEGVVNISLEHDLRKTSDTRVYDIRDLLVQVPDFVPEPLAPRAEGTILEQPQRQDPSHEEMVGKLMELIRTTVGQYDEWAAHGGDFSSIDELKGNLVIKTWPENHDMIMGLLTHLREARGPQISIEARFLLVTERFAERSGISKGLEGSTPGKKIRFLEDLETNLIVKSSKASSSALNFVVPRLTLSIGQKAYVTIHQQSAYASSFKKVEGENGAAFEPVINTINEGVLLQAQATVSADRREVTMKLNPTVLNVKHPIEKQRWEASPPDQDLFIEVPEFTQAEVETTVSVPDKGTIMIDIGAVSGPMTGVGDVIDAVEEGVERRVYMLVKPTIILQPNIDMGFPGLIDE